VSPGLKKLLEENMHKTRSAPKQPECHLASGQNIPNTITPLWRRRCHLIVKCGRGIRKYVNNSKAGGEKGQTWQSKQSEKRQYVLAIMECPEANG
jgi:hypothetical protein